MEHENSENMFRRHIFVLGHAYIHDNLQSECEDFWQEDGEIALLRFRSSVAETEISVAQIFASYHEAELIRSREEELEKGKH